MNVPTVVDRFRGCLLGGAVGDALGAPVEFLSLAEIRQRYGDEGITDFEAAYGRRGAITDDTQMTLFTAEGLIRADRRVRDRGICNVPGVIERAYLRWLTTQGETVDPSRFYPGTEADGWLVRLEALHSRRAPGNTCLSSLRAPTSREGTRRNNSKGCGAIMRISPIGLVAREPFDLGCEVGQLTHGHPSGFLAAGYLAQLIHGVLRGLDLDGALEQADAHLLTRPDHAECLNAIQYARRCAQGQAQSPDQIAELGEGWVAEEALAIGVYCALVTDNFSDAITLAVNHSGDSDSTGAITGNIVGAMYGVCALPERWLSQLELHAEIDQLARDLYDFVIAGKEPRTADDIRRYPTY